MNNNANLIINKYYNVKYYNMNTTTKQFNYPYEYYISNGFQFVTNKKKTKYNYKVLGNDWISCNVCSMNKCKIGKLIKVEGQSWNSWDSLLLNKMYCYRYYLMVIFIMVVIYGVKRMRR